MWSKVELARAVVEQQRQISIDAVNAIAATEASALEQIVMLCHEMGRQIVDDPIVRTGSRLTLEFSVGEGPAAPASPYQAVDQRLAKDSSGIPPTVTALAETGSVALSVKAL